MFGNKFAAEELARNFHKRMSSLKTMKKQASEQENSSVSDVTSKTAQEVRPEDFLVEAPKSVDMHGSELDKAISEVSSYADDVCKGCGKKDCDCKKNCVMCGEAHDLESSCGDMGAMPTAVLVSPNEDDYAYLMNNRANYIIGELGKMAGDLRMKNKDFAADMVEATAIGIKTDAIKEAATKLKVIDGLKKMAEKSYNDGDRMTGDVVTATIQNILNKGAARGGGRQWDPTKVHREHKKMDELYTGEAKELDFSAMSPEEQAAILGGGATSKSTSPFKGSLPPLPTSSMFPTPSSELETPMHPGTDSSEELTLDERMDKIEKTIERIMIGRAGPGSPGFESSEEDVDEWLPPEA